MYNESAIVATNNSNIRRPTMERIDFSNINHSDKKKRECYPQIEEFVNNNVCLNGKVVVLYGLRRTGKTTLIEQFLENYDKNSACFYQINKFDRMSDIYSMIVREKERGVKVICINEITKAKDFIENSAILPDVFARQGINIILSGTDTLGFLFAEEGECLDRIRKISTTHIPFAEHSNVLGVNDIDDYIMYGGLMKKGCKENRFIHDYESACKYLDSAVADNIYHSLRNCCKEGCLSSLSETEIKYLIRKIVERCNGQFNMKAINREINNVSVNYPIKKLIDTDIDENILNNLVLEMDNIKNDFLYELNLSSNFCFEIKEPVIKEIRQYLKDMDLLSETPKTTFEYTEPLGWKERDTVHEYYIIQPAIKYHFLKEELKFIEEKEYYKELSYEQKEYMKTKLDEHIKGLMTEQIILFDTKKDLSNDYEVCKPVFKEYTSIVGEYDMLVYNKAKNTHWDFEIKHTDNPYYLQEKHLVNPFFKEIIDEKYGKRESAIVLYRGKPFVSEKDVYFFNITDFANVIHKYKEMDTVINILSSNLKRRNIYPEGAKIEYKHVSKPQIINKS